MTVAAPTLDQERALLTERPLVFGLDEVGRGALAGPVTIGASVVDAQAVASPVPDGLRDSKLVPAGRRADVAQRAAAWVRASALGWATAAEVDEVGIIRALGLAAVRALAALEAQGYAPAAGVVLLDGNHDYISPVRGGGLDVRTVIKGDRDCASLAAASVLAKVARDDLMVRLHDDAPAYEWASNKGYASATHRSAIRDHGLSTHHRHSWAIADAPALF
ncbi:ribonuclease HII [Microbacterium oryzae]|uniref:ribonuclease HII n=1 Tax=Microbacterium oryzae TaxID=743009 RepID=UPI0025AF106E|nr:ribonuclease HII [Microbacterium oryzae]MDN3310550.1 ribonuclease HII [Microbacterium oryzae]